MSREVVAFTAYGKPVTQGSKTKGRWGNIMDDNAVTLKPWRQTVQAAALDAVAGQERELGPVAVSLSFAFDRPASHPKTRRTWPTTVRSGDLDKLVRATFDAMTDAGVWKDDAQAVELTARKGWTGEPGYLWKPGVAVVVLTVGSS